MTVNFPIKTFKGARRYISVRKICKSNERFFYPAHRHDFYELVFFNKGSGTHRIDFSDYPVAKNLIYFLSPGRIHEMKPDNQEGFIIAFPKDILYDIQATENVSVSQLFYYPDNNYSVDISLGHVPTLHNLVALLEYEAAKPNQNQKLVRNYLSALLINCLECRGLSNPIKIDDRIIKLRMEINKSYITQRSGSYYAKKVYLSLKHLNDLSIQTLGKTVTQLIHERLLLEAKREIVYTDNSIKEIAYKLRFKDPAYFNRFFKNLEGMTPNEFRKISK